MFTAVAILTSCLCIHLVWVPILKQKGHRKTKTGVRVAQLQVDGCTICQTSAGTFLVQTYQVIVHIQRHFEGSLYTIISTLAVYAISFPSEKTTSRSWSSDWGGMNIIMGKLMTDEILRR